MTARWLDIKEHRGRQFTDLYPRACETRVLICSTSAAGSLVRIWRRDGKRSRGQLSAGGNWKDPAWPTSGTACGPEASLALCSMVVCVWCVARLRQFPVFLYIKLQPLRYQT